MFNYEIFFIVRKTFVFSKDVFCVYIVHHCSLENVGHSSPIDKIVSHDYYCFLGEQNYLTNVVKRL